MTQTTAGAARTLIVRNELQKHADGGTFMRTEGNAHRVMEWWKIGKRIFILELHPNGYNLLMETTNDNNQTDDLMAIRDAAAGN